MQLKETLQSGEIWVIPFQRIDGNRTEEIIIEDADEMNASLHTYFNVELRTYSGTHSMTKINDATNIR